MLQVGMFSGWKSPVETPDTIKLRCCDVLHLLPEVKDARLVISDPPWQYEQTAVRGNAADQYECPSMADIVSTLATAYESAATDAYLFMWCTWPMLADFLKTALAEFPWRYLTGGSWHKTGGLGVGFHVRGDSEPWLLWQKGKAAPHKHSLSNAFASKRTMHSEKPIAFLCNLVEALTQPDDLVLSVYSGMCPEARACLATSRRLVGAEIDPERHDKALRLLAEYRRLYAR